MILAANSQKMVQQWPKWLNKGPRLEMAMTGEGLAHNAFLVKRRKLMAARIKPWFDKL